MDRAKIKVLLADDDPDDRDLFTEAVNEHNADIQTAGNGAQLMTLLLETSEFPDFIFLDLNMPEKSGKECLQEIRQHPKLKDIPVIIYSTSSSKKDIDDTYSLGANLYITKPNSFSELRNTVREILSIDWKQREQKVAKKQYVFAISE
ncbi:MAG: response regulator [Flavobacterium sp.]|nr:response regulator [Flavobacterium sp.]